MHYPDVQSTLSALPIPNPNKSRKPYTIPTLTFSPTLTLTDSAAIAAELEKRHPQPSLRLDSPYVARLAALVQAIMSALGAEIVGVVADALLEGEDHAWYVADRKGTFGDMAKLRAERGGEAAWAGSEGPFKEVGNLLREVEGGPFFEGKEPGFADFMVLGLLEMLKKLDQAYHDRAVGFDAALGELYKASKNWLERNDH